MSEEMSEMAQVYAAGAVVFATGFILVQIGAWLGDRK